MVSWSDLITKHDMIHLDYRQGVVALFREYEGQETDKKVRGKIVTVTVASFARHMKIKEQTLRDWVGVRATNTVPRDDDIPAPTCINDGVPPAEGLVLEAAKSLRTMLPHLRLVSAETQMIIMEDLMVLESAIAELRAEIRRVNA